MTLRTRLLFTCLFCIQILYIPFNRFITGGIVPVTFLDEYIPLWPIWSVPYLLTLVWWAITVPWIILTKDGKLLLSFFIAVFTAALIGVTTFGLFPTYVIRPEITGSGFGADLLRFTYSSDGSHCALPSAHIYVSMVLTIYLSLWHPRWRVLLWTWFGIICLSTLFTHQHYILDVVAGSIVGLFAFGVGQWVSSLLLKKSTHPEFVKLAHIEAKYDSETM